MRTIVVLAVVAGLGWLFLVQKQREPEKPVVSPTVATSKQPAANPRPSTMATSKQPEASPRPPSEHNWMKRSLDRANAVKRQVVEQRKADGTN